jgi:hypothetical protein
MVGLVAPRSTYKNLKTKKRGIQALCLLAMMGLVAPKNKEENRKKKKKNTHNKKQKV